MGISEIYLMLGYVLTIYVTYKYSYYLSKEELKKEFKDEITALKNELSGIKRYHNKIIETISLSTEKFTKFAKSTLYKSDEDGIDKNYYYDMFSIKKEDGTEEVYTVIKNLSLVKFYKGKEKYTSFNEKEPEFIVNLKS